MPRKNLHKFFISIVLPSILAIGLFIVSIFTMVLPSVEQNIMAKKKEMISELTNTAWSLLDEYNKEYTKQILTLAEAQKTAAYRVQQIRYGAEHKDYFWIINQHPIMIMHPYRTELINTDLTTYIDANNKKLFLEATKIIAERGEGFIDYMWQWKDDSTRIVPKLSYVKAYEPWGWIIGTGIYLEDVRLEIRTLKYKLFRVSLLITLIIIAIIIFVIRQSLNIENKRKNAENELIQSRQKYKSLVDASTEGTLMFLSHKIIFSNLKFSKLIGYDSEYISALDFNDIFNTEWHEVLSLFSEPKKSISLETQIKCSGNIEKDVIISISKINYSSNYGYIIIIKEITKHILLKKEIDHLSLELETSLLLMNQPIKCFINSMAKCSIDTSIHDAAIIMTRKKSSIIFIQKENDIIGLINNSDLKKRVIAQNINTKNAVIKIMTSPVISISENALLYEAILLLKNSSISHLAVKNGKNVICGVIGYDDISKMQENAVSYLIKEIEIAENIEQLQIIHARVPVLVNALVYSGDKTQNITRIITSVTDAITHRIIILAIETVGTPPCKFAFMVVGSEGRKEQTLSTDQDNAIIFDNQEVENINTAHSYFQELGQIICLNLSVVGYKLCKGKNMANNPKWTQPFSIWKEYFSDWINTSEPQSIMDASIFFDFRCVYGKESLITDLHNHVNMAIENKTVFFYHLAQSIVKYKPPISLFGKIIGNNQSNNSINLDIKKILLPIISFIRLYSIYNKVHETNSILRIKQLHSMQVISKDMYNELVLSYNYLMQIRFRFQSKSILNNEMPDNIVDINKLTHIEIATIKKIFGEISNLQTKINFDFNIS